MPLQHLPKLSYLIFALFAVGPSYVLLDCTFVQVPYFQLTQPENHKLATYMTAAASIPAITFVPLYYIIININWPKWQDIPYRVIVHLAGLSIIFVTIIMSLFWHFVAFNTSVTILICVYFAAAIGNIQGIALVPWITTVDPKLVAPVLTGNNVGVLIAASIGFIQDPGNEGHALFTPTVFFSIWIGIFILSYFVWMYIDQYYLPNLLQSHTECVDNIDYELAVKITPQMDESDETALLDKCSYSAKRNIWQGITFTFSIPVWWRKVFKYCVYNIYLQFGVWIWMRSLLPFAAAHTTRDNSGELVLSYAINIGYVAILLGSLLAMLYQIQDFTFCMVLFTICCFTFAFYVFDDNYRHFEWNGSPIWSQIVLILICLILLFLNGFVSPLIYRRVSELYPNECEAMNRWMSAMEKVTTFFMIWITFFLVEKEYIQ